MPRMCAELCYKQLRSDDLKSHRKVQQNNVHKSQSDIADQTNRTQWKTWDTYVGARWVVSFAVRSFRIILKMLLVRKCHVYTKQTCQRSSASLATLHTRLNIILGPLLTDKSIKHKTMLAPDNSLSTFSQCCKHARYVSVHRTQCS